MRFATIALLSAVMISPLMIGCTEHHEESTSTNPFTGTKTTKDTTVTQNPMNGESSSSSTVTKDNPNTGTHSQTTDNK